MARIEDKTEEFPAGHRGELYMTVLSDNNRIHATWQDKKWSWTTPDFAPADHPLRPIRVLVNKALTELNVSNALYADTGRESIAQEKLLRTLQVFYSVRSKRQIVEQLRYNLPFRWFVGIAIDDTVWNHSVFSKNRDRLLANEVVESFFTEVIEEHFGWGQDCGPYSSDGVSGNPARRSSLQADYNFQQHHANGPNTGYGSARSGAMKSHERETLDDITTGPT